MAPLIYFLSLLVSMLGLGVGAILAFLAEEELGSIRRYLAFAKKLLLGGLMGIVGFVYSGSLGVSALFFALGFGMGWAIMHDEGMIYLVMGGVFFVASLSESMFPLACSLIMLYGFASGTIIAQKFVQDARRDKIALAKKVAGIASAYALSAGIVYCINNVLVPLLN